MTELKVGDTAPDFSLSDEHGLPVSLKDYLGKKVVVLYFQKTSRQVALLRRAVSGMITSPIKTKARS